VTVLLSCSRLSGCVTSPPCISEHLLAQFPYEKIFLLFLSSPGSSNQAISPFKSFYLFSLSRLCCASHPAACRFFTLFWCLSAVSQPPNPTEFLFSSWLILIHFARLSPCSIPSSFPLTVSLLLVVDSRSSAAPSAPLRADFLTGRTWLVFMQGPQFVFPSFQRTNLFPPAPLSFQSFFFFFYRSRSRASFCSWRTSDSVGDSQGFFPPFPFTALVLRGSRFESGYFSFSSTLARFFSRPGVNPCLFPCGHTFLIP